MTTRESVDGPAATRNSSDAVLEAVDVEKVYNNDNPKKESVRALSGASMVVKENEFVVIVGPSGCGKTTLLHTFAGLRTPTEGEVQYNSKQIAGPSTERAVVFQRFNLFPWRTVKENVAFGLEMTGVPDDEAEEIALKNIELVSLDGFEDAYPGELSGGMQQRVGLARALAVDPEVLLMDEPFGALDAQTRELMQEELLEIWEQDRKTILFVTHDIDEALFLADRILVMGLNPRVIKTEIEVPFERPRYNRNLMNQRQFSEMKQEIWDILKEDISIEGA